MTTSRRYRLPDWLGGGEYAAIGAHHDDHGESMIRLNIPGVGVRRLPSALLTHVEPEPPNGTYFGNGIDAIVRLDDPDEKDPDGRWWTTGIEGYRRWVEIAPRVTGRGWQRYVPETDAAELEAARARIAELEQLL